MVKVGMVNRKVTIKLREEQFDQIQAIANNNGESLSETIRKLLDRAMNERILEENTNLLASLIRQQMEIVIKPYIERLAKLSSKSGHMSATSAFLNAQALMDIVPVERRKDVRDMYDSARKKAVVYFRENTNDFNDDFLNEEK